MILPSLLHLLVLFVHVHLHVYTFPHLFLSPHSLPPSLPPSLPYSLFPLNISSSLHFQFFPFITFSLPSLPPFTSFTSPQYTKVGKLTSDAKFEDSDVKASIAALSFIISSGAKHSVDAESLSNELQQLGLPKGDLSPLCMALSSDHGVTYMYMCTYTHVSRACCTVCTWRLCM